MRETYLSVTIAVTRTQRSLTPETNARPDHGQGAVDVTCPSPRGQTPDVAPGRPTRGPRRRPAARTPATRDVR